MTIWNKLKRPRAAMQALYVKNLAVARDAALGKHAALPKKGWFGN